MCYHHQTLVSNIVILGASAAGLAAALAARQRGCDVVVVGQRLRNAADFGWMAGGINAALGTVDPEDSWQQHFADTWRAGYSLGQPATVQMLAQEAPAAVLELANWGCNFARTADDKLDQRGLGAHTWRRSCYVGDYTEQAITEILLNRVDQQRIPIYEDQYVTRLLVYEGVCYGMLAFDLPSGQRTLYLADAVILATGGHSSLWRRNVARTPENNSQGMALALAAGCELMDMELVQFSPTAIVTLDTLAVTPLTEAVRGEGGRLLNQQGERFMQRYDPKWLELSTNDQVALAVFQEVQQGRGGAQGGVFLDISQQPKQLILQKLPHTYQQCLAIQQVDISQQPVEVAPAACFSLGGVKVDPATQVTGVAGLYAVGEVAAGIHGANLLGGNALSEALVFGKRAGDAAAIYSALLIAQLRIRAPIVEAHDEINQLMHPSTEPAQPLQQALHDTLWTCCGMMRNQEQLQAGFQRIGELKEAASALGGHPRAEGSHELAQVFDLRFGLWLAEATLRCASERRESRGVHQRSDYPQLDPALQLNFVVTQDKAGQQQVSRQAIPALPENLRPWIQLDSAPV